MPENDGRGCSVRFVLEISHSDSGVSGRIEREGRPVQFFSSWLELLSALEATP